MKENKESACLGEVPKHQVETLDEYGLFLNRNILHRYMGPAESFPCCGGKGLQEDEDGEFHCDCLAGAKRREVERG